MTARRKLFATVRKIAEEKDVEITEIAIIKVTSAADLEEQELLP
jgi:hypothetical protein